jgi:pimeloyl-ACP methyl ester carboxylesterase
MSALKWAFFAGLVGYVGVLALMYFAQRSLMYFPERVRTPPAAAGLPQAQEVVLQTGDGEKLIAWHVPPRGEKPVVLYFHGNGGALALRASRFRALVADGTGLLALSYRGYGGSSGSPTESGLILDAEAVYRFAAARYPATQLALWGESLGTGVAVALAGAHPVGALILDAPFTSAADVGAGHYPFLPVRWLIKDPFYSDRRIADVYAPVLVLHGGRDSIVPIALGEQLFALIPGQKQFVRLAEAGHNDLDEHGAMQIVGQFLAKTFNGALAPSPAPKVL